MGKVRKAVFAALVAAAIEQLRKPENQQRIRELIESRRAAKSGRTTPHT